jgi:hypothetical protein
MLIKLLMHTYNLGSACFSVHEYHLRLLLQQRTCNSSPSVHTACRIRSRHLWSGTQALSGVNPVLQPPSAVPEAAGGWAV